MTSWGRPNRYAEEADKKLGSVRMKITGRVETEAVTDVRCDVCDGSPVWTTAICSMGCPKHTGMSLFHRLANDVE